MRDFIGKFLLTRWAFDRLKAKHRGKARAQFKRSWPRRWLYGELVVASILGLATYYFNEECKGLHDWMRTFAASSLWTCVIFYLAWLSVLTLPALRVGEIVYAFYYDAMDKLGSEEGDSEEDFGAVLSAVDKIRLILKSYPSLILNWSFIYFALPTSQFLAKSLTPQGLTSQFSSYFEALYFSGVTITTVGYGDFLPTGAVSRLLSVCEVFSGMLVILLTFVIYLTEAQSAAAAAALNKNRAKCNEAD